MSGFDLATIPISPISSLNSSSVKVSIYEDSTAFLPPSKRPSSSPIALAVLIFALLGYVVFRSTRKQGEEEIEPELSVDALLESTANTGDELENIGYSEKSETRVMIEKFVDENPDAAALLLRNWLNEDWE